MHTPFLSNRLGRWLAVTLLTLTSATAAQAQLAGPKAIPGDYASVAAAITALNAQGVGAGGVTFNIAAGYTETFASPTAGAITATGTAAGTIVFQKAGAGANPKITAGVGTTTTLDAIISLAGSDYVTFDGLDVAESATNTTTATQAEFGYALFRASATDGAQFNVIRNCVVTLNKTNAATIGIAGLASTSAAVTAVSATSAAGANSGNKIYGNVVTNSLVGIYLAAGAATAVAFYDQNNEIGVTAGNTVGNFGGTASAYGVGGTYQNGLKVSGNTINSTLNYTSATASTAVAASTVTSTLRGIYTPAGTSSSIDITNNTITLASGATTSQMSGIENSTGSTAAANTVNITGNTVTNCAYLTATSATFYGIYNTASAATVNISGNTVSNNTVPGTGSMNLISGGAPTALNITTNQVTGNSKSGAAASTSGSMFCIAASTAVVTATGNTINNNSTTAVGTSSATIYGYYNAGSPTAETVTGNTITNLSIGGTTTSTASAVYGTYSNPISTTVKEFSQNVIGNLSTSIGGTVYGIYNLTGNTVAIARNKVYGLSAGAATGVVYGLYISSGTAITASNNLIGDLSAPASTNVNAVTGVYVGGGTATNLYFNTIQQSATSSSATTFGTSGIYVASTTPTVDLRNNVVVNNSTPGTTGGAAVALRFTSATVVLASTTNNNLYYAGTPGAANLIYAEGTTTLANAKQTLADYKAYVAPRELNSLTENVPFQSTTGGGGTFLHVSATVATQVEGSGMPIASITTDFDGDARNATTPDLGADEGTFTPLDLAGPTITLVALGNTPSTTNRTLAVTISDPSGIATGANAPRLFFRKGTTGAFQSVAATSVSGSTYTFTFDYALLGSVMSGDNVQYYVVAQDASPNNNVSSNQPGGTFTTAPAQLYQFLIQGTLSGIYYVGTGTSPNPARTYATLTAAASAYNNNQLGGAVTFVLLDASYGTAETFPIILNSNADASATNTLTINPAAGVTATIAGSVATGAVLKLNGADYVTIDGSNNGTTSQDLTITNTSATGAGNAVLWLAAATATDGATNNVVKNTNITGTSGTGTPQFVVFVGGGGAGVAAPTTSTPAANSNNAFTNNIITKGFYGVFVFGVSATVLDQGNSFTGNQIGQAASGTGFGQEGLRLVYQQGVNVTGNEIQNIASSTAAANLYGIFLADSKGSIISRNSVHGISYTGASTTKVWAINATTSAFTTVANASANRLDNNLVYGVTSSAISSTWNTVGINLGGGYGDQIVYNTVYLSGQLSAASGTAGSAAFANGNPSLTSVATNIDVRNNIFSIIGGTGGTAATPLYAHYEYGTTVTGSTLDNNDLFVTTGATGLAVIGHLGTAGSPTGDYATLALWRTATSQEASSVSVNPQFTQIATSPFNLTPSASALNGTATPITGVTVDYPGTTRGTLPDIGAYEFAPALIDIAATALVSPAAAGCYGATETVSVSITNNSTTAISFATNPSTVTVTVTKPNSTTQVFAATLSTGTLAANTAQTVTLPGTLDMSAAGTYSFAITTTTTGDGTPSNDNLTATRTVTATATLPQFVTFTGFTGSNLSTVFPGWSEATGATIPAGTTSAWTSTAFPAGNTTAKINLFSTGKNDWVLSPKLLATTSTVLTFDAGLTDFSSNAADPVGMTGTDDFMEVRISTDCGLTFARIPAFAQFNATNQPSNGSLTTYSIDLSSYAGQQFILGFFASEGAVDDAPDYDFHIDNINVRSPLPIDLAATALAMPTTTQGCYSNAETVAVTVSNQGSQALDFSVNPATVTAVVTTPGGPQTLTGSITTGTLAAGATQNVTLAPTLDMTAVGTYTFAITATVTGDANPANDALTPAPTRTKAAPVAGTLAPASTTICVSGTAALTLTGAANGSIQYQSSLDNVTFTDVAGATTAAYTTPVLTSTTYYRAQVRCGTTVATSNVSTITVNNPLVVSTNTPVAICSGSTATLTATASAGSSIRFFDVATGGTALAGTTPGSYTTAALTASATYYAEAFSGGSSIAGLVDNAASNGTFTQSTLTDYPLGFAVSQAGTLTSVDVYPTAVGALTIRLYRTTGGQPAGTTTAVAGSDVTITVTAAQVGTRVTVPLNYVLAAGDYRLSNSTGALGRFSTYTGSYPLTSGALAVTGSYTSASSTSYSNTTYNSFFNLTFNSECAGATRTAIQVNVTQPATASFTAATGSNCGTSAYQLTGTVGGSATSGTYTSSGTGTFSPNASTLTATYTPSAADLAAGTVTITLTSAGSTPCPAATATFTLTISSTPVATFSYATATGCAGSAGTASPTLGTAATAGAFTSTTGLVINATTGVINLATSTAGTYTVTNTVAATGTCAAATATATFTVNPRPATPTISVVYNGATTTLTSSAATGNQFFLNGVAIVGATGQTYVINGTPAQLGSYTVVVTNANGCASLPSVVVVITAAKNGIAGTSLRLYPNPTPTGQVVLELTGYRLATQLTVMDALGRVVASELLPAASGTATHTLNLTGMASGVYLLRLSNTDGTETRRLVRE